MDDSKINSINRTIESYSALKDFLLLNNQIGLEVFSAEVYRKYLLVACASLFENQIQEFIVQFVHLNTNSEMILALIKSKAVNRQYHTYFSWKEKNANSFYSLFGSEFAFQIKNKIKTSEKLKEGESAFLEIGLERNLLVHENFMSYQLNKTVEEIIVLFNKANIYIEFLQQELLKNKSVI